MKKKEVGTMADLRLCFLALVLIIMSLFASVQAAYGLTAFGSDDDAVLSSFITRYGWDSGKMTAYTWIGLDGREHTRWSSFEKAFADDMFTTNEELAFTLGLISRVSAAGGNADSIIAVALAEVAAGETDVPIWSNNCKYNTWHYGRPVSGDSYPWCCAFISWCANECGLIEAGVFRKTAGCAAMRAFFNEKGYDSFPIRSAKPYGGTNVPVPGDVIIWGANQHIALIVAVNDSTIETVEGNTYPRVAHQTYAVRDLVGNLSTATIFRVEYPDTKSSVYNFLVRIMGLPSAAACGVMANIEHESGFNADIEGDAGTSFGLCQWHAGRWDSLRAFCDSSGYDWQTMDGQLHFLQAELESLFPALLNTLRTVPNSGEGAYRAGYEWCIQFERPSDMYSKAASRGNSARTRYWPEYGQASIT